MSINSASAIWTIILCIQISTSFTTSQNTSNEHCKAETINTFDTDFLWTARETRGFYISKPPCFDYNATLIKRECRDGKWHPKTIDYCTTINNLMAIKTSINITKKVEAILTFDRKRRDLYLIIYHPDNVLKVSCYAFSEKSKDGNIPLETSAVRKKSVSFKLIFDSRKFGNSWPMSYTVHKLQLDEEPNEYSCVITQRDWRKVQTENILGFGENYSNEYAARLSIKLKGIIVINYDDLFKKSVEIFEEVCDQLGVECRLMEVFKVDMKRHKIDVLYHLTSRRRKEPISEYYELLNRIQHYDDKVLSLEYLRNTDYCIPETSMDLYWRLTPLGAFTRPERLCLHDNGTLVTRKCSGNFLYGAKWKKFSEKCSENAYISDFSQYMYDTLTTNFTANSFRNITSSFENLQNVSTLDISLLSDSLYESNTLSVHDIDSHFISSVDNLFKVDKNVLKQSQITLNSTDRILDSIDVFLDKLSSVELNETVLIQKENFVVFVSKPGLSNVSGIVLYGDYSESFLGYRIEEVGMNETIGDLDEDNLELAVHVPQVLFESLTKHLTLEERANLSVIITLYNGDGIFNEDDVFGGDVVDEDVFNEDVVNEDVVNDDVVNQDVFNQDNVMSNQDNVMSNQDNVTPDQGYVMFNRDKVKFNHDNVMSNRGNVISNQDNVFDPHKVMSNQDNVMFIRDNVKFNHDNVMSNRGNVISNQDNVFDPHKVMSNQDNVMFIRDNVMVNEDNVMSTRGIVMSNRDTVMSNQGNVFSQDVFNQDKVMSNNDNVMSNQDNVMSNQDNVISNQDNVLSQDVFNQDKVMSNNDNITLSLLDITNQDNVMSNQNIDINQHKVKSNQENVMTNQDKVMSNNDNVMSNQNIDINQHKVKSNQENVMSNQNNVISDQDNVLSQDVFNQDKVMSNQNNVKFNGDNIMSNQDNVLNQDVFNQDSAMSNQNNIKFSHNNVMSNQDRVMFNRDNVKFNQGNIMFNEYKVMPNRDKAFNQHKVMSNQANVMSNQDNVLSQDVFNEDDVFNQDKIMSNQDIVFNQHNVVSNNDNVMFNQQKVMSNRNNVMSNRHTTNFNHHNVKPNQNNIKSISNSRIISVTIPGLGSYLEIPIPLIFRPMHNSYKGNVGCGFWNYGQTKKGKWSTTGGDYKKTNKTIHCSYNHLTHFGLLILTARTTTSDSEGTYVVIDSHLPYSTALSVITVIGCTISLIGVLGIFVTAVVFRRFREKLGTKILIQLSMTIILEIILTQLAGMDNWLRKPNVCTIVGVLLHYVVLSKFCWMLVIAGLQYLRFVRVLGAMPKKLFLKAILTGWFLPILPVLCTAVVSPDSYTAGVQNFCYPKDNALYIGLILPVALIVSSNVLVFVMIMVSISKSKAVHYDKSGHMLRRQTYLAILLFFMLGIPWIFGILAEVLRHIWFEIVFVYLFCLTATLQGFVLFAFYVVFDKDTRLLWTNYIRYHK